MKNSNTTLRPTIDISLIACVIILLGIGFGFLYSASKPSGIRFYDNQYYYIIRQGIYLGIGIITFIIGFLVNHNIYKKYIKFIIIGTIILLILTLMPYIGKEVGGAKRWIAIPFIQFQPSEIAKISIILYLSSVLSNKQDMIKDFYRGVLPPLILVCFMVFLIFIEPDFSTSIILIILTFVILFLAEVRLLTLIMLSIIGSVGAFVMLAFAQYRLKRFLAFLNPWVDPLGSGWQYIQSMKCFAIGKGFGVGIGESTQKNFALPEAQNDYIFAIIAEEGGAFFSIIVVILFISFAVIGLNIAKKTDNKYSFLLASGITLLIFVQALINISVVVSILPSTGITLPFVSAGGTSLITFMFCIGILMNISYLNGKKGNYQ